MVVGSERFKILDLHLSDLVHKKENRILADFSDGKRNFGHDLKKEKRYENFGYI